jgi:predicted methyltransferase
MIIIIMIRINASKKYSFYTMSKEIFRIMRRISQHSMDSPCDSRVHRVKEKRTQAVLRTCDPGVSYFAIELYFVGIHSDTFLVLIGL